MSEATTYMTAPELRELTGLMQPAAQIRWLKANAVVHYVRVDGKPRVPKDANGHPIKEKEKLTISGDAEPNFSILRSARLS